MEAEKIILMEMGASVGDRIGVPVILYFISPSSARFGLALRSLAFSFATRSCIFEKAVAVAPSARLGFVIYLLVCSSVLWLFREKTKAGAPSAPSARFGLVFNSKVDSLLGTPPALSPALPRPPGL